MKIPVIIRKLENGKIVEEKYILYIEGTSWGLIRPWELTPLEEIIAKTRDEVIREYAERVKEYPYCYPSIGEIKNGVLVESNYVGSECIELAWEILEETRRRLNLS